MTDAEFTSAYEAYGHLVRRRCLWILRDAASADDAVQEAFIRLWRYSEGFAAAESKLGWLYRVAERCAFDRLRKGRAHLVVVGGGPEPASEAAARAVEDRQLVSHFLAPLDDRMRQLALHHFADQMTQEEIAQATGWTRKTVAKKILELEARAQKVGRILTRQESIA